MKLRLKTDKPTCGLCGSTNTRVQLNVGSDIDPSGEETQHLDGCNDCGAIRLWAERWHDFKDYKTHEGNWHADLGGLM